MSKKIQPSKKIHSLEDARKLAKKRLPKMFFDFVDGAAGDEKLHLKQEVNYQKN